MVAAPDGEPSETGSGVTLAARASVAVECRGAHVQYAEEAAPNEAEASAPNEWVGRRVASTCIRGVVLTVPLVLAALAALVASESIAGSSIVADVVRIVVGGLASVFAFVLAERLARRLLPLAALLRLTLVFPDRAPSRLSVAMRSTSVRKLQQWARNTRGDGDLVVLVEKVATLAAALNFHDRRTRGHSERSRAMAELLIEEMRLGQAEANEVRWGAFLHDIGKLLVPAEILNKPGKPTPEEWEVLKQHPGEGGRLVEPLRAFLGSGVEAVSGHHENFDGTGYPLGLSGDEIALAARIVAVADAFEVMTAVRSYKRPMTAQAARSELVRQSGSQFDPKVVRAFMNVPLGRVHWALGIAAWAAELPFVTFVPRAAAQVSALTGWGTAASTTALTTVAAATLGAAVIAAPVLTHTTTVPGASAPAAVSSPASGSSGSSSGHSDDASTGASAGSRAGSSSRSGDSSTDAADSGSGSTEFVDLAASSEKVTSLGSSVQTSSGGAGASATDTSSAGSTSGSGGQTDGTTSSGSSSSGSSGTDAANPPASSSGTGSSGSGGSTSVGNPSTGVSLSVGGTTVSVGTSGVSLSSSGSGKSSKGKSKGTSSSTTTTDP